LALFVHSKLGGFIVLEIIQPLINFPVIRNLNKSVPDMSFTVTVRLKNQKTFAPDNTLEDLAPDK
jgi:hypothetical protein